LPLWEGGNLFGLLCDGVICTQSNQSYPLHKISKKVQSGG